MNLNSFIADKNSLASVMKALNTPEGRALMEKIKRSDRSKINDAMASLGISGNSSTDAIRALANDPNVLAKINDLLK